MSAQTQKIMAQGRKLEIQDQLTLVRSTKRLMGTIDRIREYKLTDPTTHLDEPRVGSEKASLKAGEYLVELADLIKERDAQLSYLQKWGTKVR